MQNKPEIPNLEDRLKAQSVEANAEIVVTLDRRIDTYIQTFERATAVEQSLRKKYGEKSAEIKQEILDMRTRHQEENSEEGAEYYLRQHQILLDALSKRFELGLEMAANEDGAISTMDELRAFIDGEFKLIAGIDIRTLMQEKKIDFESIGESIPPDYIELVKKMDQGAELTPEDWDVITLEMRKLAAAAPKNPREAFQDMKRYVGFVLIEKLDPAQRLTLLEKMLTVPNAHRLVATLVLTNYLSVAQGIELCETGMKTNPGKAKYFAHAMEHIASVDMKAAKAKIVTMQDSAVDQLSTIYSQNLAGKFISLKGILGWFIFKNLAVYNVIGNVIADPKGFYTNPAFWGGIGVAGGLAEEYTGGMGRGLVTRAVSKAARGKDFDDERDAQRADKIHERISMGLGDNPLIARFYYENADRIALKVQKNDKDGKGLTEFTLDEIGIDYDTLPEKYKSIPKKELESEVKQFAALFFSTEGGLGLKTGDIQKRFINDSRKEQGLSTFKA